MSVPSRIELHSFKQSFNVCGNQIFNSWFNHDLRVEGGDFTGGGDGLGKGVGSVFFIEQRLTLQIAGLDVVAVDDAQSSNTGASQQAGQGGAGSSASDNGHAGGSEFSLAFGADTAKQNLARITLVQGKVVRRTFFGGEIRLRNFRRLRLAVPKRSPVFGL